MIATLSFLLKISIGRHIKSQSPSRVVVCYPHHTPLQWAE